MGHQTQDISLLVQDAGDVARGDVRLVALRIAEHAALLGSGAALCVNYGDVVSSAMRDREADRVAIAEFSRQCRLTIFRRLRDRTPEEFEVRIAREHGSILL